jgi:hypothetical protein
MLGGFARVHETYIEFTGGTNAFFTIQLSSTIFSSKLYIYMARPLYGQILKFGWLNWRALYHP